MIYVPLSLVLLAAALVWRHRLERRERAAAKHLAWYETHRERPSNVVDITPALKRAANRRR